MMMTNSPSPAAQTSGQIARRRCRRLGATAVEFTLTAPILFLFIATSVEFARMNMIRHTVDNAAYEAARRGIVPGATAQDVEDMARTIMSSVGAAGVSVTITPAVITEDTEEVTVEVTVPCDQNGFLVPKFFAAELLVGRTTMTREQL